MADQLTELVKRMQAEGVPESDIVSFIQQFQEPVSSHEPAEARPIATGGGRGTGLDVRKSDAWLRDNAPTIGATLATTATGGASIPLAMLAAAGGGTAGAGLRGDAPMDAVVEGGKQALLEGGGRVAMPLLRMGAHGLMRGTIPKNIAKDFEGVNIAQTMLDRGVVPGSAASAKRVEGLSRIANQSRDAMAATAPKMTSIRAIEDMRPLYQQARAAGKPERASDIAAYAKRTVSEMGGGPHPTFTGDRQLARKDILQQESKAALNAANPRQAALDPQLANAERTAITRNLRSSPKMAEALDQSQVMMAIDQVMKDAAHSNPITRVRVGGLPAAAASPMGLGLTAHAVNQGAQLADPQLARALLMLLSERSGQE